MDALLFKELSSKMVAVDLLLLPISKENSSFMKPCHQVASEVEESLNSVWPYLKDQDGMLQTTAMLSLTSMVKVKDALS